MDQRSQSHRSSPKPPPAATMLISALILGICFIIAGSGISGAVKKLTAAVEGQTFAYQSIPANNITVNDGIPKNYFTETEAASYLNITVDEIKAAITKGEIDEYIMTSTGYSISRDALDEYFDDKAYDIQLQRNSSGDE